MRLSNKGRCGSTLVESALIYPIVFLLLMGLIVAGLGIFRYQEMSSVARKAARYASVHGTGWAKDTGNPAATPTDIYNNAIVPNVTGLDLTQLTYSVTYNTDNDPYHTNTVSGQVVATANVVSVTVKYNWIPEGFLGGITLSSTSSTPMSN
jgi:Flp pilus assembly protein TadG